MNPIWLAVVLTLACTEYEAVAQENEAYCYRNKTVTTFEDVTKSRLEKQKTGWMRSRTVRVNYTERVPKTMVVKVRECCEGYKLNHWGECDPVCADFCPPHAECTKPNTCQCTRHYIARVSPVDGSLICEPHCPLPCPANSRCVEPFKCLCDKGYMPSEGKACVPKCLTASCLSAEHSTTMADEDTTETETNTEDSSSSSDEEDDDNQGDSDHDDEDGDDFVATLGSLEDDTSEGPTDCPSGFIHYKGECRPLIFASNDKDCRYHACPERAQCTENGTCACIEGFWLQPVMSVTEESTSESSTVWDFEEFSTTEQTPPSQGVCMPITELLAESEEKKTEAADSNWMSAFFIAFGLACIACAAVFLGVKLLRHRHGQMDVEAKNDMRCEYDSREENEKPMVY